jgi:hypothetical protein
MSNAQLREMVNFIRYFNTKYTPPNGWGGLWYTPNVVISQRRRNINKELHRALVLRKLLRRKIHTHLRPKRAATTIQRYVRGTQQRARTGVFNPHTAIGRAFLTKKMNNNVRRG